MDFKDARSIDWKSAKAFKEAIAVLRKGRGILRTCSQISATHPCLLTLGGLLKLID